MKLLWRVPQLLLGLLLMFVLMLLAAVSSVAAAELPGDSVYRLDAPLVDQNGRAFAFAARAGKPQLVSMFYTSCPYVCPLIVDTLKKTQAALTPAERANVDVLLISFDPERDTPARLNEVFAERHLDAQSWTLARTEAPNVRKLAALFGIQYRARANGEVNHSSALLLLDGEGRIVARTETIGAVDAGFVEAVRQALR
jgi:protein SCO1/2